MILRIGLVVVMMCFMACASETETSENPKDSAVMDLTELDWMIGKWKNEDSGELELWSKKEDSFFGGMMVKLNENQKAVIQEVLSLEGRSDGIYFSTKGGGTRKNAKIEFKMSNSNFDAPKFTSPTESNPKHISYMKVGSDKIKVDLQGPNGDVTSFYYIREI
jgi:hypothetical protein